MMWYIMPELLIITLVMLNEIKLKLLGLYWQTELEIESVNAGIDRTIARGDEEEVHRKQREMSNMNLVRFYESSKEQQKREEEYEELKKDEYQASFFAMSDKERSKIVVKYDIKEPKEYSNIMFKNDHRYKNVYDHLPKSMRQNEGP
jgi:hypothetical protein